MTMHTEMAKQKQIHIQQDQDTQNTKQDLHLT